MLNCSRSSPAARTTANARSTSSSQGGRVYLHLGARRDEPPRRQPGRPMAELDPDQAAALRRLRAAFGFVEILAVADHEADQDNDDEEAVED